MSPDQPSTRRQWLAGFTLVELMIVVAIIGVLAAIAIPNFYRYQLRTKSAEALVNLQAISKAQEIYWAEYGAYVSVSSPVPGTLPGQTQSAWPGGSNFDVLGWEPEGGVFYQYMVSADNAGGSGAPRRYTAEAGADLDGDSNLGFYAYVKPAQGASTGLAGALPGTTCQASGVYAGSASNVLRTAGPCDAASGKSRF